MKKNFKKIMFVVMASALAFGFMACGDDDDDEVKGKDCVCTIGYADPEILIDVENFTKKNWKGKCSEIEWGDLPFSYGVYWQGDEAGVYTLTCE